MRNPPDIGKEGGQAFKLSALYFPYNFKKEKGQKKEEERNKEVME